jgi:two-component system, OmpR family, sensor histidine kinase KdpD
VKTNPKRLRSTWAWYPHRRPVRAVLAALAGPALVTLLGSWDGAVPRAAVATLYVGAVALSTALGGTLAGIAASAVSFLALNFFFTPPQRTLAVSHPEDLIALVVFLVVSIVTGLLLSDALAQKARAQRREIQTGLLNRFANRLLSGDDLEVVLRDLGKGVVELFGLNRCELETTMTSPVVVTSSNPADEAETHELELVSKGRVIGKLHVTVPVSRGRLDQEELTVLRSLAGQLALALESVRLQEDVKRVSLEAETSRLRAALFSGVTHDLKTPLSVITASATSLLDGSGFSPRQQQEHLEAIREEADHLNRVVTNLLDLSRLRAGALTPSKLPAPIDELIEAVIARMHPLLEGRDVNMDVSEGLPEVSMDVVQMDQVLTNLIENAVKFSPPGSPVRVSAVGNSKVVRVTVTDRGPGIDEADRGRVFQPFERGDGQASGTGLGLAISKAIVVAHGGRMWARAAAGGGAALTFELPVAARGSEEEVT